MKYLLLLLFTMPFIWTLEPPIPSIPNNKLENPFENDTKLISFLDSIRCGTIEAISNKTNVILRFSDYKNAATKHLASLAQAQSAIRYASIFGHITYFHQLKIELLSAQLDKGLEPDKYPGLPTRITELKQEIDKLQNHLNSEPNLPDVKIYPETRFVEPNPTDSPDKIALDAQNAINQLTAMKNDEKRLCRVALHGFYTFWTQQDLSYKQTDNDHKRDLEQIKKNRHSFFEALEKTDGQKLLTIPSESTIKKASRSCIDRIDKTISFIKNYDPQRGSPQNSDDEIY